MADISAYDIASLDNIVLIKPKKRKKDKKKKKKKKRKGSATPQDSIREGSPIAAGSAALADKSGSKFELIDSKNDEIVEKMVAAKQMTETQKARYESSKVSIKDGVHRTMTELLKEYDPKMRMDRSLAFVVSRVTKVLIGDIVEVSRDVMEDWGDTGPVRPAHIREAHRRLTNSEVCSRIRQGRRLLR